MDLKGKGRAKGNIALMDLPLETLKAIVGYVPRKDQPNLARVSREFHPLASAELYRVLDLKLTNRLNVDYNTPNTRVEDTLRTIVTSEHDYAQYIKVFGLSISEHGSLGPYESHMFLSTVLFLLLKRAKILESFRWATSKTLDESVYRTLHNVQGLQHLYVRLEPASLHFPPGHPLPAPPMYAGSAKLTQRQKSAELAVSRGTFSGFRYLGSLAILDIDNLEYAAEIAQCLRGSSGTLKKLSLSLSSSLAMKARKPSAQHHGAGPDEDTETEPDDVDFDGLPTPSAGAGTAPTVSEADIRKERSAQEAMLAQIFSVEQVPAGRKVDRVLEASAAATASVENPDRLFMKQLKNSIMKLQGVYKSGGGEGLVALKSIQKAAEKYLQNAEKNIKKSGKGHAKSSMNGVPPKKPKPVSPMPSTQAGFPDLAKYGGGMPGSLADPYWSSQISLPSMSGGSTAAVVGKMPSGIHGSYSSPYVIGDYPYVTGGPSHSSSKPAVYPLSHGSHSSSTHGSLVDLKKQQILLSNSSNSTLPTWTEADMEAVAQEIVNQEYAEDQKLVEYFIEHESKIKKKQEQDLVAAIDEINDAEGNGWAKDVDDSSMESKTSAPPDPKFDQQEDSMGVDIEHPDVIEDDSGDDQEMVEEREEANGLLPPSRKQARFESGTSLNNPMSGQGVEFPIEPPCPPLNPVLSSGTTALTMSGGLPEALLAGPVDLTVMDDHVNDSEALKTTEQTMRDYLHSTHGLPLEEFSLYLLPIKASVLSRAIDLTVLKRLTLLNVGSQGGLWSLITKMQQLGSPIRLQAISTDNVSTAFLACLESFEGLIELFMLERSVKTEVETFAAKTNVGIEDIRKRALKRHVKTLKRLIIMNEEDNAWDADAQTVRLLTSKGQGLEELAIGFSLANYHLLMQWLPGLKSLTAFHIVAFHSDDNCPWLARELRKFTIDNISHCPDLKIEYLAINATVSRIARKPKLVKVTRGMSGDEGSSEEEGSDADLERGLEMAVVKNLKFFEVEDVRIFEKEVLGGTL